MAGNSCFQLVILLAITSTFSAGEQRIKRQFPDAGSSLGGKPRPTGDLNSPKGVGTSIDNAVDPFNLRGAVGMPGIGETVGSGVQGNTGNRRGVNNNFPNRGNLPRVANTGGVGRTGYPFNSVGNFGGSGQVCNSGGQPFSQGGGAPYQCWPTDPSANRCPSGYTCQWSNNYRNFYCCQCGEAFYDPEARYRLYPQSNPCQPVQPVQETCCGNNIGGLPTFPTRTHMAGPNLSNPNHLLGIGSGTRGFTSGQHSPFASGFGMQDQNFNSNPNFGFGSQNSFNQVPRGSFQQGCRMCSQQQRNLGFQNCCPPTSSGGMFPNFFNRGTSNIPRGQTSQHNRYGHPPVIEPYNHQPVVHSYQTNPPIEPYQPEPLEPPRYNGR